MSTYVIGDIQGCSREFRGLIELLPIDWQDDELWLVGDLVNRGPDNAGVLDLVMSLPNVHAVLGNHDLHFLAVESGVQPPGRSDTIDDLLHSDHRADYAEYLRGLPLLHTNETNNIAMAHAGLPPQLSIEKCRQLAAEVQSCLQSTDARDFFQAMYGNEPAAWDDSLTGMTRLRVITNYFTRLRYCTADGEMELTHKSDVAPPGYAPWFSFPRNDDVTVVFGHWAAIEGKTGVDFAIPLDTGCVWGRHLTAMRLEDRQTFVVSAA